MGGGAGRAGGNACTCALRTHRAPLVSLPPFAAPSLSLFLFLSDTPTSCVLTRRQATPLCTRMRVIMSHCVSRSWTSEVVEEGRESSRPLLPCYSPRVDKSRVTSRNEFGGLAFPRDPRRRRRRSAGVKQRIDDPARKIQTRRD